MLFFIVDGARWAGLIAGHWGKNRSVVIIGRVGCGGFIGKLGSKGLKEGLRKKDGLGSESWNSSDVSMSELVN